MKSRILGLLAVGLLAGPMTSNALVISISGQGSADGQWDVSTVVGPFAEQLPTLEQQVWWGSRQRALAFTNEVLDGLGLPNSPFQDTGPFFAYAGIDPANGFYKSCAYFGSFFDASFCGNTDDIFRTFAVASRVETVEDQSNLDVANTSFSGFGPWQQEVLVGVTGLLGGLEITFERLDASAGTLAIWTGSPWQTTAPLLSATYSDAKGATYFDLSAAGLYLSAGDRFTFGLIGTSGAIRGSYTDQPGGNYPGDLYTDDPSGGCYVGCGYDLGFRTFMVIPVSDPDPVPEPGTLALLGLGLASLGLSRRRKAN